MLAYIPSPSFNTIGPFRLYGVMIAIGVYVAVVVSQRRWVARGGTIADVTAIATWSVPAGLIGARLYHVTTDWKTYQHNISGAFEVWNGGLGIPGGVLAGVLTGIWVCHRRNLPVQDLLDVVAPAIPIAQAIGRLGNWFNQELYGRPSTLPWALKIDVAHREPKDLLIATYHPTFLYEALWNLALVALLLWIDRKHRMRPGSLFASYVLGYGLGRLWVESLRFDPASKILGLRVNIWTSGVAIVAAGAVLLMRWRRTPSAVDPADSVQAP